MGTQNRFLNSLVFLLSKHRLPGDELSIAVVRAQQNLLYRQLLPLACLPLVTATLMAISLLSVHSPLPVILWYLTYITMPGALFVAYLRARGPARRRKKTRQSPKTTTGKLSRLSENISLISGIFWGITAPLFGSHSEEVLIFIAIVQVSHVCGFAQLVGAFPRMVFRFSTLTLIPLALVLMLTPSILFTTLGVITLAVFAAIMFGSFTSYRQLRTIAHSEARARRAETLLRSSVNAMPDAFAVYAFNGEMILENTNHKAWGLDYIVPVTDSGERIAQSEDGRWIKHTWHLVPEAGTLTIHTDITSQKRREALLIETREQAQLASGAQSRFLSRVSHELRTPLNSVLGFSEMLIPIAMQKTNWSTVEEYADYIHSSGQHLLALVDDIIDYTSIGDETDQINTRTIDLSSALKRSVEIGRAKAGTISEHKILMRLHQNVRHLKTDQRIFERIIANIISNSIKFSAQDSKIAISSARSDTGNPTITIRDFGYGMTPEQLKDAFSVFYQADDTHKREFDGTGMGLAVVKKLADLIDIDVQIVSKTGRGTAVILIFNPASAIFPIQEDCEQVAKAG